MRARAAVIERPASAPSFKRVAAQLRGQSRQSRRAHRSPQPVGRMALELEDRRSPAADGSVPSALERTRVGGRRTDSGSSMIGRALRPSGRGKAGGGKLGGGRAGGGIAAQAERSGAAKAGGGRGWRAHGGKLQAWVHVAQLRDDGTLDIPNQAQIVVEIGANTRNTLDRELLPIAPSTFLLTFEPLLDKFASLMARNSKPDTRASLGYHHPRGMVLPFAVSGESNAVAEFKISGRTDGCASLLDPVASYYSLDCTNTSGILERRAVPSVSLEVVLGSWLRGRKVELAKVDAQGLDVGVVRSAGPFIDQLKAVQLEVVRDRPPLRCDPQYAAEAGRTSEAKCGVLVAAMAELGYAPYDTTCAAHKFKEAGGCEVRIGVRAEAGQQGAAGPRMGGEPPVLISTRAYHSPFPTPPPALHSPLLPRPSPLIAQH